LVAWSGCASPSRDGLPAVATAEVAVENHTDLEWRIAFRPQGKTAASSGPDRLAIMPRETRRISLAGGVYRVSREVVVLSDTAAESGPGAPGLADETTIRFEAGRTYAWPLGTLLSTEEPGP
jgi:hypothetical protein